MENQVRACVDPSTLLGVELRYLECHRRKHLLLSLAKLCPGKKKFFMVGYTNASLPRGLKMIQRYGCCRRSKFFARRMKGSLACLSEKWRKNPSSSLNRNVFVYSTEQIQSCWRSIKTSAASCARFDCGLVRWRLTDICRNYFCLFGGHSIVLRFQILQKDIPYAGYCIYCRDSSRSAPCCAMLHLQMARTAYSWRMQQ